MENNNCCPVCNKYFFDEEDNYYICSVCGWENDGIQYKAHNYAGGANNLSVNERRIEYFLMQYELTKVKAKKYKEIYIKECCYITDTHRKINHRVQKKEGKSMRCEYAEARKSYMNKLINRLLTDIIINKRQREDKGL